MNLIHGVTVGKMFENTANKYPMRPAVWENGRTLTYSDLLYTVDQFAKGLLAIGIKRGTEIGFWCSDTTRALICFLAVERIGAVAVLFNTGWKKYELHAQKERMKLDFLISDDTFNEYNLLPVSKYIYIGEKEFVGTHSFYDVMNSNANQIDAVYEYAISTVMENDTDMILFTSGSTGEPRGVVTNHFSRVNMSAVQADMIRATQYSVICACLPSFHCFGLGGNILAALYAGACIAFPKSRKTSDILECVERAKCTVLTAVPTLFHALISNENFDKYDLSSLECGLVGGSMCSAEFLREVSKKFDFNIMPSLGQTEATSGITCSHYDDPIEKKAGTVGFVIDGIEYKFEDGELCIKGFNVMQGYYSGPEFTAEVLDKDGWLHTGDMGYELPDGRICLTDRRKNLIIRAGENISPAEIETVIMTFKEVRNCKVIGLPDIHYGEIVCACVEIKDGCELTEQDIKEVISQSLAAYKVPQVIKFFEKIPLLSSGKVDVLKLKKSFE